MISLTWNLRNKQMNIGEGGKKSQGQIIRDLNFFCLFIFESKRDRAQVGEGQRETETQNLKQAPV